MNKKPWLDAGLDLDQRVCLLISAMTLEEKVGQLMQLDGQKIYLSLIKTCHVGSLLHINGQAADQAIGASLETRLGIPVLLADDGIHGHSFWAGATIFPTQLAMACSWDPDLLEAVARVTAREMRVTGLKWTFSPVLCLTRDLRWGRVNETFGEDPFLIGELGCAMIRGYQGKGLSDPEAVLATAKHFAGYSETLGGRDASEADLSQRRLRAYFLPPFEKAAKAGCMSFMTGYQSIDGVPSTANKWLLHDVLRQEWGYTGVLVTDWNNVGHLVNDQKVCPGYAEAAALAIRSGNDLMMATPEFYDGCQEAIRRGLLTMAELDAVVGRVLGLKFRMGLFENPGKGDPVAIGEVIACQAHRELNLRAARESLVLLRNETIGGQPILPFNPDRVQKLAIVGPNADNPLAQLGDWSLGSGQMVGPSGPAHPRESIVTVLDGLKNRLPSGWSLVKPTQADLVIMVLGDDLDGIGEGKSTATLELRNGQKELCREMAALGKPLVTVLVNSKPLVLPVEVMEGAAILEAFNPGMQGGTAIAEALFGDINPSGRLTVSFPYHVGQQPVYYNQTRGQHGDRYADLCQEPAFAFGFGLGYASFRHSKPVLAADTLQAGQTLVLSTVVTNTGARDGVEVVQLYIEDIVTSATWARRELKAFRRISLAAGSSQTVRFELPVTDLSIVNAAGLRVVEPGRFRVLTGSSSRDYDLQAADFTVVG